MITKKCPWIRQTRTLRWLWMMVEYFKALYMILSTSNCGLDFHFCVCGPWRWNSGRFKTRQIIFWRLIITDLEPWKWNISKAIENLIKRDQEAPSKFDEKEAEGLASVQNYLWLSKFCPLKISVSKYFERWRQQNRFSRFWMNIKNFIFNLLYLSRSELSKRRSSIL